MYIKKYKKYMNRNVRKRNFLYVFLKKSQISLCIHAVWSESSLSACRNFESLAIPNASSKSSDEIAHMHKLILTHLSLASHKRDIGKQCRSWSDAAERGVWSGSTLFALN